MSQITALDLNLEILEKIVQIEKALARGLKEVSEKLDLGREPLRFFDDALKLYRDKFVDEVKPFSEAMQGWFEKIRNDEELGFPHRKILEFLLGQYDFQNRAFQEAHFSRLVKEARVGKNMAKKYLAELEEKGYVEKRNDGYRIFFKIKG